MLIHCLLDDIEHLKLDSYQLLISTTSLSFTKLRKSLKLTSNKMTMIITELETDLSNILGKVIPILQDDKETLLLPADSPNDSVYRQFLLENSLIIRVFSFILTCPESNLDDFCQKNFLSRATAFRRLSNLQELLAPYRFKLNISQLKLTGNELAIRHFLGTLFWSIKPDLKTNPSLKDLPPAQLIDSIVDTFDEHMAYGTRNQIVLFLQIAELRRKAGYYPKSDLTPDDFPLCDEVRRAHHLEFTTYLARTTPADLVAAEELAFYFQMYTGAIYTRTDTRSYAAFREWLQQQSQPQMIINSFCDKLLTTFFSQRTPEHFDVLAANIMGTFNLSYLLKDTPSLLYTFFEPSLRAETPAFWEIENFSYRFFRDVAQKKEFHWLKPICPHLASLFAYFLLPTFNTQLATKKLKVSVTNENNFILALPLQAFLEAVPYIECIPYSEDHPEQIDLLISAHKNLFPTNYDGPSYLYTFRDIQDDFINLRSRLESLHLEKCFQKKMGTRYNSQKKQPVIKRPSFVSHYPHHDPKSKSHS